MKTTGVPVVFYSEESSELKTGNLKKTMEMFLSSVVDTLNFFVDTLHSFMEIRTLQCEIQRLKNQTMIEISNNIVSQSVTLFEKGTHVERAGSLF